MSEPRRKRSEADDDFSLRTPTRRRSREAGSDKPAKKKSGKRPSVEDEPVKKKKKSGKRSAVEDEPAKKKSGKRRAAEVAPAGGRSKAPLLLGALAAAGIGAAALLALSHEPEPVVAERRPAPVQPSAPDRPSEPVAPVGPATTGAGAQPLVAPTDPQPLARDVPRPLDASADTGPAASSLEELAARSATHAEVARILEEYADVFKVDLSTGDPLFADFAERQRREEELIARIRALGPLAVSAVSDMLLGLGNRAQQIFLAKALAGIEGPEALAAVGNVLGQVKDAAIQTTLVRFLPETPDAMTAVGAAYGREDNPNLRTMLLREYARRAGDGSGLAPGQEDLFRQAALQDADQSVRAEAVTLIGRRGRPEDQGLLEEILRSEQNVQIRQRAMVAYAETGGQNAMTLLEDVARDTQNSLPIRASAVLAIGRVGGDQAIASLDLLAQTDPDQEIRTRANRLAQSLRARREAAQNPQPERVTEEPIRMGPSPGGGLDRR